MPAEFHFLRPEWFFALIPVVLLSLLFLKKSSPLSGWEKICDPALLKYQIIQNSKTRSAYQNWLRWLIPPLLTLVVIALAGPSWSKKEQPVFQKNTPLVIVLDLSYSMNTTDIKPSRLERAKLKIMDILQSRTEGQSALIAYAGDTHVVSPLTIDNKTILSLLPALSSSIMPIPGSQLGDALSAAEELLKNAVMPRGRIIVLTDGVDDLNAYAKAAQLKNQHYPLSVIGIGTPAGSPVPSPQHTGFMKDSLGQVVLSKLDPASLEELAQSGGGEFHTLSLDDSDFTHVLAAASLDDDQVITQQDDQIEQWIDQGALLTLFILPFALLAFRKGVLVFAAALVLIPALYTEPAFAKTSADVSQDRHSLNTAESANTDNFWQYLWKTPDQKGQESYNHQDYAAAAQHFEDNQWKAGASYRSGDFQQAVDEYSKTDDAESWYNRGNALANLSQFNEAINAYGEALKRKPELADALSNKEYLEELLEKQQQQQQQQQDSTQQENEKNEANEAKESSKNQSDTQDSNQQDQQQNQKGQDQQSESQDSENGESQDKQDQASQSDDHQQDQNQSEQDNNQQQEAEQNLDTSATQAADQENNEQQQQALDSATADQEQQDVPEADDTQQQSQTPEAEEYDSKMDHEQQTLPRPPRDVMSQLSQEEQQSLNQWLQRIPDDPSELLRRKFYMNSQLRQRQQMSPPNSKGNPW